MDNEKDADLAKKHGISVDAVKIVRRALEAGGGRMAQFSHPDFGGMSQWSPGMAMVGDMFNDGLKAKLAALCTDLAAETGRGDEPEAAPERPSKSGEWWPAGLGRPSATGGQNGMRYAAFPETRRLAIEDGGTLTVYDTGDHRISGVSQAQSSRRTLSFTSQLGAIDLADLPVVKD